MEPDSREVDCSSPAAPAASQPAVVCTATNLPPAASFCVNKRVCVCVFLAAIYDVVEEKADSEPDFQYIPEKSPQDPTQLDQHALRDSMVVLKDGLGSGAVLAQFDVRTHVSRSILHVAEHLVMSYDIRFPRLITNRPRTDLVAVNYAQTEFFLFPLHAYFYVPPKLPVCDCSHPLVSLTEAPGCFSYSNCTGRGRG